MRKHEESGKKTSRRLMSEPTMGTLRIEFQEILSKIDVTCTYNYGMDMKKYVEGGPEWPDPGGSMKYQFVYLNVL
jgi:hypothetical protein